MLLCFAGFKGDQKGEMDAETESIAKIAEVKGAQQIPADGILLGVFAKDATRGSWPYY